MSLVSKLKGILKEVHKSFKYADDEKLHGKLECWDEVPEGALLKGDCEEFARKCCVLARDQGLPARLVFCGVDNPKGDHLVCEVEGYILDNRSPWVLPQERVKYYWISISGYSPGEPWRAVV